MKKPNRPRVEPRKIHCAKCGKTNEVAIIIGVSLKVTLASIEALRCPRCRAHPVWLRLI